MWESILAPSPFIPFLPTTVPQTLQKYVTHVINYECFVCMQSRKHAGREPKNTIEMYKLVSHVINLERTTLTQNLLTIITICVLLA